MDFRMRRQLAGRVHALTEQDFIDDLAIPEHRATTVDGQLHVVDLEHVGTALGLGQIDLHGVREQRCGDDEDHQQHQHDVDERITLISAIGALLELLLKEPKAMSFSGSGPLERRDVRGRDLAVDLGRRSSGT
jgi:hypothetical protein